MQWSLEYIHLSIYLYCMLFRNTKKEAIDLSHFYPLLHLHLKHDTENSNLIAIIASTTFKVHSNFLLGDGDRQETCVFHLSCTHLLVSEGD